MSINVIQNSKMYFNVQDIRFHVFIICDPDTWLLYKKYINIFKAPGDQQYNYWAQTDLVMNATEQIIIYFLSKAMLSDILLQTQESKPYLCWVKSWQIEKRVFPSGHDTYNTRLRQHKLFWRYPLQPIHASNYVK